MFEVCSVCFGWHAEGEFSPCSQDRRVGDRRAEQRPGEDRRKDRNE